MFAMTLNTERNGSERGVALFIAIFTLLLITAIAAGLILLTNTDTMISSNFRDEQTAFFGAKGGFEEVRDRFRPNATNSLNASMPTTLPGQNNGVLYVLNPTNGEADTPWVTNGNAYPDTEICREMSVMGTACAGNPAVPAGAPWYKTANASAGYAAAPPMSWKWTRVTLKTNNTASGTASQSSVDYTAQNNSLVCWTGLTEVATNLANCPAAGSGYLPVYVLTTLSVTPSGSRRMVQAEAVSTTFPTLPGAMIFDGPNPIYGAPNSNAFAVSGNDAAQGPNAGVACPAAVNEPAVGGYDAASVATLTGDIPRPPKYTGVGGSPSVTNVNGQLGSLATVQGLNALVTQVTNAASPANIYNGNAAAITNPGTNAAPVINVVTGDLTLGGGFSGSGILLVEGNLTMSGNPSYNGLILVIGTGSFTKNGGGTGTTNGSILVANLYNSSGQLITSGAPGNPTINWNGGGNANIQYDSCWSSAMSQSLPYRIVAVRELMY